MAGFWSRLLGIDSYGPAQRVLPEPYEPYVSTGGIPIADPGTPLAYWDRLSVDSFWRSQPNVRKVVDFIARNVASIPINCHQRIDTDHRERITDGPLAAMMRSPRGSMGAFRFWHAVLSDGLLYDRWAALVVPQKDGTSQLVQIPSWRLRFVTDTLRQVNEAWYWVGDQPDADRETQWKRLDLEQLIFDHGYSPTGAGYSPIATLRDVLDESAEAVKYRRQVWKNGPRIPGYIKRPAGLKWDEPKRTRFLEQLRAAYADDGPGAGGLPLMEDGMEIVDRKMFTPQDANDLEGRRLTAIEVAAAFHVAPELVGAQQGNYSNVKEYRQMLYRDSLGPYIRAVEETLNNQLVPLVADRADMYVEANVDAKLRGSFEEQAAVKSRAVGGPWLTRNEARAMENRPPLEGGDELITPLNVTEGGQANPADTGEQNETGAA